MGMLHQKRHPMIEAVTSAVGRVILGKEHQVRLALACLLARGHLLLEDLPGVGKTTLSHALARVLGLHFQRIQFTSDLLPADILGVSVFDREKSAFVFHPGPVFNQLILADEVNRATPKAQSALLEAMEEHQVTVEGETRRLPEPFFVIATQNPAYHTGVFPLPESQLDRFLMRLELGFPDPKAERALLAGQDRREMIQTLEPVLDGARLQELQQQARAVQAADALLDYVQSLLDFSRVAPQISTGLSPRAGLALLHAAQAWALMEGRTAVLPEDVQAVLPGVAAHRLRPSLSHGGLSGADLARLLRDSVPVP
jgi:MoxR-like ATPase